MTLLFWAFALLLDAPSSSAAVLTHKATQSGMRPFLFVDDSGPESMDRAAKLPSQNRTANGRPVADAREYLLTDTIDGTNRGLGEVANQAAEELLKQQIFPVFARLMRSDLGTSEAPMTVLANVLAAAVQQLRARLPEIEAALAGDGSPRRITWLVAPWNDTEPGARAHERYAPGQLGFNLNLRTPVRDFGTKHTLFSGTTGQLEFPVHQWAEWSTRVADPSEYTESTHAFPPYVYPVGFQVTLKIARNASSIKAQLLLGLQPLVQPIPPSDAGAAQIKLAGVPQPKGIEDSGSVQRLYPMALATFAEHEIRKPLPALPLHVAFGVFDGYSSIRRELSLRRDDGAWRMTPYLGGDVTKLQNVTGALGVKIALRVHLTDFHLEINPKTQTVTMSRLNEGAQGGAIEIFGRGRDGKLLPGFLGHNFEVDAQSGTARGAAAQIQDSVNKQVQAAIAEAKTKGRAQTVQKFPMAALFLDRAQEGGAR